MVVYCAVYGCTSSSKNKQRLFYPFPLDEVRCSAWIQAAERPDLGHFSLQNLHNLYRVCDMHFVFLDQHKILLDDAIPSINLPPKSLLANNTPNIVYQTQRDIDEMSKSTQTDFSNVTESTQTYIQTSEIACQTKSSDDSENSSQWKVDNPLKRKLLITLAFDNKAPKTDDDSNSATSIKNEADSRYDEITCHPDLNTIVSENETGNNKNKSNTKEKTLTRKVTNKKKGTSKIKKVRKEKLKEKRKQVKKSKIKIESSDDSSAESEQEVEYDAMMTSRLETAIKMIQQQWKIHEKKYRKDKPENETVTEDPIEKLRVKQGRAYGDELKFLALNLFYSNPAAYKALRQNLNLPTEKTLRRIEVGISTKLTPTVLNCLKLFVSKLNEEEKFCTLNANILTLKEEVHKIANSDKSIGYHEINELQDTVPACKTLVLLIKGLHAEWKQPLITCYLKENFDEDEVNKWLDDIIISLTEIGLRIVAFTTNEHPNLLSMAKKRSISVERPFFYVNNLKVYYIYDISHVLISLRNLLLNYYFKYIDVDGSEQIASWFDIEKLYETDKNRVYKLAPKLTEKHIIPSDTDRNKIQYSVQVFSKTVAVGIISCIEQKHLTVRSFGTVKFVELVNNVYDVLNSFDEKEICRFKTPFSFKDYQINVLEKMLSILQNLKIISKNYEDVTAGAETLKCFEITIRAVLSLASDLKTEGYQYLCTRNLTLEHLDSFFESMRRKWGVKPSAVLFYAGFRNFFLENLIMKSESNDSCGLDKDLIAILLKDNPKPDNPNPKSLSLSQSCKKESAKDFNPFFKYL